MLSYVLVGSHGLPLNGFGLEPGESVSELVGNDAHTVEIGVVLVYLVIGVSPTVADSDTLQVAASLLDEGVVLLEFQGEGRDVVSCKGLSGDVKGTGLEGRPLDVEVVEEVEQVIASLSG
jgi:hypothetical protein